MNTRYSHFKSTHDPRFLNIGVDEYYDNFWAEHAPFAYDKYSHAKGEWDIKMTKWGKNNKMKVYSMVPIEGVPFYTETTCDKTIALVERTPNKIIVEMDSITREAPYGETLTCQEVWVAISLP